MKHLLPIQMSLFFCLLLCHGCSYGENEEPAPKPEEKPSITVPSSQTPPVFNQAGGNSTYSFTATADWTISTAETRNVSWLTVQPLSGKAGEAELTVITTANDTPDERRATVTIKAVTASCQFVVSQKQKDALTVTSNKIEMPSAGGQSTVEVKANVEYEYEIDTSAQTWIIPTATRGLTTSTLIFNIAENEDPEKREGKITVRSGELSETVTVYQEGSKPSLVLTRNEYTVSDKGEEITVELRSNINYEVKLPDVGWITETVTRAFSTHTHHFTITPNETYDARTAEITFINKENGIEEMVKVTQVQWDAIIVAQSEYKVPAEQNTLDFKVNTNVDFTVSVSADWIKQNASTKGLTEKPLSFTIEGNASDEERTAVITLTSGDLEQNIQVIQKGKSSTGGSIDDMPTQEWE